MTSDGEIKRSTHLHLHPFCSWCSPCWWHRKMKANLSQNHILSWRRTDQCHRPHTCMFPSPSVCSKHCCIAWQAEEHYACVWLMGSILQGASPFSLMFLSNLILCRSESLSQLVLIKFLVRADGFSDVRHSTKHKHLNTVLNLVKIS